MSAWTRKALPHSQARAAMRIAVRSASSAGSASATWRARSQLTHAATMSRVAAHAPARMCQPNAAWRSPAASRCSAINAAFSSSRVRLPLFDRGGHAAGAARRDRT